jgi:ribonuclease P protein subunit RPR2
MSDPEAVRQQLMVFAEEIRDLYKEERTRTRDLERALTDLNEAYLATMKTLAFLVEAKDVGTRMHLDRTHQYGMALARVIDPALSDRPELGYGFLLHDIGKIGISERILNKQGPLTPSEWSVMKTHPLIGAQIVSQIRFLGDALDVIRCHHERFDGSGYPRGLERDEIPLSARIFSVVDAFDAMTSDRPYRRAMSVEQAMGQVVAGSGAHFDPEIVEAFLIMMEHAAPIESAVAGAG